MKPGDQYLKIVDGRIEIYAKDGEPLPTPTAVKKYSGKFNLRAGTGLYEQLSIAALRAGESLNSYCLKQLQMFGSN